MPRQNERVDLERATHELYGLAPALFTAGRNARATEARKARSSAVAVSLKELRKPSAGHGWPIFSCAKNLSYAATRLPE